MCAGQGRDVIDVLATHPRARDASALLVELDPGLVAFARDRAAAAGMAGQVRVVEGDASRCRWYRDDVPADVVLVCGVFGNISRVGHPRTIQALPGFCRMGSEVIWTRHRRPPDATPSIRAEFAAAGFTEVAFEAPDDYVLAVGRHRLERARRRVRPRGDAVRVRRRRLAPGVTAGRSRERARRGSPDGRDGRGRSPWSRERTGRARTTIRGPGHPRRTAHPRGLDRRAAKLGRHPLHPLELISMARRTFRLEPGRVLVPAVVIFGLTAVQGTWLTEISVDHLGFGSVAGVVVFGVSTLGLTFYSGMLERLVGAVERNEMPAAGAPCPAHAAVVSALVRRDRPRDRRRRRRRLPGVAGPDPRHAVRPGRSV